MEKKRELVAYYSFEGNTKIAAEIYAGKKGAVLCEIELLKNPKGKLGFMLSAFGALLKSKAKIKPISMDIFEGVEEITIASPVWAASLTPAANAFLAMAPLEEKRINVITVQADEKHEGAEKIFQYVSRIAGSRSASAGKLLTITGSAPGKTPDREKIAKQIS